MRRLQAHLDGCDACAGEWRRLDAALRLVEDFAPVMPPSGLWSAILQQIEGESGGERASLRETLGAPWWRSLLAPWMLRPTPVARAVPAVVALAAVGVALWSVWGPPTEGPAPIPLARVPMGRIISQPELVAAVQQHSLASTGQFFADRVGLETMVQIIRHEAGAAERTRKVQ
jgi:hypothetical protein